MDCPIIECSSRNRNSRSILKPTARFSGGYQETNIQDEKLELTHVGNPSKAESMHAEDLITPLSKVYGQKGLFTIFGQFLMYFAVLRKHLMKDAKKKSKTNEI